MSLSKGKICAIKLLNECGIDNPTLIRMEDVLSYRNVLLIEEPMNADGRIIHGKKRSMIKVNSLIKYVGRRRFTIAHELGHFEMHRDYPIHSDLKSLNWFDNALKSLKYGKQELEANEFASEFLMPSKLFKKEVENLAFSPSLLRMLSDKYKTSITSIAFKFVELDIYPICVFFLSDGVVKYWKKSNSLKYWITDRNKMPPHEYSVAAEYIDANYESIYTKENGQQEITKSIWFNLRQEETDSKFYEYCIVIKEHKTILSIVWED